MSGTITGCVNKGTVRGGDHVGGVVGLTGTGNAAPSEVNDCVNTGTVTATNNLSTAGGVVGECKNEFGESTVKNCSNTGAVSIDPNCEIIGGVVGVSAEGATYSNNYYAAGTAPSGIYGVADAEGKIKSASNIIVTKQNMIDFRDRVNSGEYDIDAVLGADVDLEGDATHQWTPIANTDGGNYSTHYIGTFDGNGHTISGLYMDDANSFAGLFGYLTTGGVIKNLTVSGEIKKCTYGGGIVTFNYGGTVINCVNYVNITSVSGEYWAGGVVGSVKNNANVASGVFGAINCVNYGNIQGPYCVGGVVGYAKIDSYSAYNPDGIITGCVNYGTVSGEGIDYSLSSEPVDSVTSMFWIGGIVGFARAPISYCVNNGSINATGVWQTSVGGIVAQVKRHDDNVPSDFSTACCVNNGNISVTVKKDSAGVQHYTMIGGIIGKQESLVENCYNTGAIVQTGDNIASYDNYVTIGGVSGYIANEETTLRNCYNVGTLIGEDGNNKVNVDPLRGLTAVDTIVTGCHYLAETTDTGTGALTEADFAIQNNFDGWDFDKVWIMKNGRPNLFGGFVKYYDKNGAETSYEQPRTVLSSDEVLPANNLNNVASFGADYNGYYGANGATHSGWATIRGGEKVYDFGAEYAGAAIDLYPMYEIDPPTVSADGYSAAFDNDTHELTVTVTHDLGAEATYTYQWYKLNEDEYEEIAGATNATYGVKYVADSGTYKVIATLHFAGYAVDGEKAGIVVAITKIDPEYTIPTGVEAKYGQTLAVVTLSDGWAWDNNAQSVGEIGDRAFSATYTPEDTDNYNTVTTDVTVTVGKADPTYDVPVDLTASIGDTLSSVVLPDAWAWVDDTTVLNKIGPCPYAATFTPEDTTHYNIATVDLTVGVYHVAWDGVGDGTEGSPYVITNKAQLEHYRDIVNGDYVETENEYACAVLANDIDLNGNNEDQWIPIGNVWEDGNNVFRGVFDGNNKTISRLYINTDENDYESKGLFGVTFRATIKNLTVDGSVTCRIGAGIVARPGGTLVINCVNCATVTASQSAGGVAGFCVTAAGTESYAIRDTQIINCVNNGDVTGFYQVGGIAYNNGGDIYGCVNNGDILINRDRDQSHDSARAGGIAASSTDTIAYCVNNGSVTVILNYPYYSSVGARVGGICASQWINEQQYRAGRKILYCVNNGQVLCQHTSAYSSHGTSNAGGITGFNNCVVENCYNTANVTGTDYVGGICGKSGG
ncbi:MAG: hypothetical protein J5781_00320, partial [Clostridia bacterium]|nr:hypothetical protein [Clostridia bacterium]